MRELLFITTIAGLALLGCGDDGAATDAGPSDDAAAGDDAGGDSDAGPRPDAGFDAGTVMPGEGFARNRAALDRIDAAGCACDFMARGFATAAECEAFGDLAAEQTCEDMAFAAAGTEAHAAFDCRTHSLELLAVCLEGAACDDDTEAECIDQANMATMDCPDAPMSYADAFTTCYDEMVVGTTASACPENAAASSATGDAVFTGTTVLGGDDTRSTCGGIGAPDRIFQWTAPAAGLYDVDTIGSTYDTMLHVFTGCPPASLLGCDDDIEDGIDQRSRARILVADAQTVFVAIDGFGAEAGDFQININPAP